MAESPALSVVVVSLSRGTFLASTLRALELQAARPAEVLVILPPPGSQDAEESTHASHLAREFPTVRFIADEGNVPRRRARGVREARGEVVALIEDTCVPAPGWAAAVGDAHARCEAVVGGPVIPAPGLSAASLAAFLVEFGAHLARRPAASAPPGSAGPAGRASPASPAPLEPRAQLPGCNLSYPRPLLLRDEALWSGGLYETFVNDALARRGTPLLFAEEARVVYGATTRYASALAERLAHGRNFGALRSRGRAGVGLLRAAASPLLVPLLAARMARSLASAGSEGRRLAHAFPATLPLFAAWALGEAIGSIAGPGRTAEQWT